MKLIKFISSRIFITVALLAIQLGWFFFALIKLTSYYRWISSGFYLLSILMILYIIGRNANAAYKIGWIILIMALPIFGGILYLVLGNKGLSKWMQKRLGKQHRMVAGLCANNREVLSDLEKVSERVLGTCRYLSDQSCLPVYRNTDVTYYPIGEEMYRDMLLELKQAKKFIFLEYFIINKGIMWDGILEILTEKAAAGLDVRIIYDDVGSLFLLPQDFTEEMKKKGIRCVAFNQFKPIVSVVMNHRDHRKIMVIDGHTAFTGGINLADEYINAIVRFGHWKDTGVRLKGDAVWSFTVMFLEMWNSFSRKKDHFSEYNSSGSGPEKECAGFVQPYSDSPLDDEPVSQNIYIELLSQARKYVYIFTPYLIIGDEMKSALCLAAKRGVDVRIVTPGIPDKKIVFRLTRSNYPDLLKAGVRIYEYTPGFIHAKSYICDDEIAVVGTVNMDYRSLYLHFECGVLLYKTDCLKELKQDSLETIDKSREHSLRDCKMGFFGSLLDAVFRVFAPLL